MINSLTDVVFSSPSCCHAWPILLFVWDTSYLHSSAIVNAIPWFVSLVISVISNWAMSMWAIRGRMAHSFLFPDENILWLRTQVSWLKSLPTSYSLKNAPAAHESKDVHVLFLYSCLDVYIHYSFIIKTLNRITIFKCSFSGGIGVHELNSHFTFIQTLILLLGYMQ